MNSLLIGCRVSFRQGSSKKSGIVMNIEVTNKSSKMWVLLDDGVVEEIDRQDITVSKNDINRIKRILSSSKRMEKVMMGELLDL